MPLEDDYNLLLDPSGVGGAYGLGPGALGKLSEEESAIPSYLQQRLDLGQKYLTSADGALSKYEGVANTALAAKKVAIQRGLDRLLAQQPDHTATLLAMASGLLKPTRTGSFFESLGQAGEAALNPLIRTQDQTEARKLKALEYELGLAGVETEQAKLGYTGALERAKLGRELSSDALRLQQALLTLRSRQKGSADLATLRDQLAKTDPQREAEFLYPNDLEKQRRYVESARLESKAPAVPVPRSPAGKQAADEGYELGTPEFEERAKAIQDAKLITPGQRALDTAFAKDYAELVAAGGFADIQKNISQLQAVRDQLKTGTNLTGAIQGRLPDWLRSVVAAPGLAAQQTVEEVVQRNLRAILGAQFTQVEGERLIARAYNPALDEKENIIRLDRLLRAMEDAAKAKEGAINYFEEHGTLRGFKGQVHFTTSDLARRAKLDSEEVIVTPEELEALED